MRTFFFFPNVFMCNVFWKCHGFGRTDGDQIAEADRYMVRFVSSFIYHIPFPSLLTYLITNLLLPLPSPLTAHPIISYCTYYLGTLRDTGPHFLAVLAQVRIHTYIDSLPSPTQRYLPLPPYLPPYLPTHLPTYIPPYQPTYQPTNQPTYLPYPSQSFIHFFPIPPIPNQRSLA